MTSALVGVCLPDSSAAKVAQNSSPAGDSASMVTLNSDGTMIVKRKAASGNSKDAESKDGLGIPAQVIAPTVRAKEKQQDTTSPF